MNLIDAIRHHARVRPYDVAVIHATGAVNYLQLAHIVTALSARLRSEGLAPGMTTALFLREPFMHLSLMLAAMATGVASTSAPADLQPVPPGLKIDALLADSALPFVPGARVIEVSAGWIGDMASPQGTLLPAAQGFQNPQAMQRYFTSSGTTGAPKIMGFTGSALESLAIHSLMLQPISQGPAVSAMGLGTIGGYGIMQSALWHGTTLVQAMQSQTILRALSLYGVRTLRLSPQQLQGLLDLVAGRPMHFANLERIEIGGAAIPNTLLLTARTVLCPNVMGVYGSTEAGLVAQAPGALLHAHPDAAGYVMPGVDVRIVDDAGVPLGFDAEGLVQIRTPHMVQGYLGDDDATAAAFRDGWFVPGDLGLLRADGLLLLRGRMDEIINLGGVKINPATVDDFLLRQPGVREAATFARRQPGRPDEIWAAVVPGPAFDAAALLDAARARLQSRAPARIVQVAQIPRNAMGKALRQQLSSEAAAA
ncbi:fatty acid--CoA ligase family protein [Ramlibacter sp.]|uniref:class I adenylate-forming enzyme family protein n=1 Tax=Ramlibacter sp. TaxID=1917967 RepID=UPI0017B7CC91|nr:fatty acid--CoA ligase family protein [Ramlibacter sp.]MBA2673981.1 long-chain fatty acid--CoA ligase [Ramlibacter sp.]